MVLIALFCYFIYHKLKQPHNYWSKLGVKNPKPTFLVGNNYGVMLKSEAWSEAIRRMYTEFPNEKFIGIYEFLSPAIVLRDPEVIRQITVKDFDHFMDHAEFIPDGVDDMWSKNLFASRGDRWRDLRPILSPAFTSNKMRSMFNLISDCSEQFVQYFIDTNEDKITLEMEDTFTRFANDVIATCAFGLKCDSMKEKSNQFYLMGKDATDFSGIVKTMSIILYMVLPKIYKALGFTLFSKNVNTYFSSIIKDTMKTREENNIIRHDMIHLLMEAKKGRLQSNEETDKTEETTQKAKMQITDIDIIAQAMVFFFAGFETTSILLCMMSYELAINQEVQDKLIEEVDEIFENTNGSKITYEAIHSMKYLDMVVSETLRKWPPFSATERVCTKPYSLQSPNHPDKTIDLKIKDPLWIPIFGIHRDPKHYPNPDRFDPERFNDENRDKIHPYAYLPFGAGPRFCIGSRFALMEAKTVFVYLLRRFRFVPVEKTEIPFQIGKKQINIHAANGNWLGLERRGLNMQNEY